MKKLVFSGCSFTAGNGWIKKDTPDESRRIEHKEYPGLWVNLCHKNISRLKNLELINCGKGGASNTEIFENIVELIAKHNADIDTVFCQWTSMPRYNFNVGFELWDTSECLDSTTRTHDVNLNRGDHWPRKYINNLIDRLLVLHHLHWEILKVVRYCNIITNLAKNQGIKNVFFINGLCPWDQDYFVRLRDVLPECYTPFTKKEILNIDTRDDEDIHKLYNLAHDHYQEAGGSINESHWINLYNSFLQEKIDSNFDNSHPGKQSNFRYYQIINDRLTQLNFI